jgi:hypothetical protein
MTSTAELLKSLAALPGDWHGAGCLEMPNLEALARHASARTIRRSLETGAGKSTLLLSHLSAHHLVFSVNDGDSLTNARTCELLKRETVEFIDGPSQHTLMNYTFTEPLQLVFIDGPHGFPFPNMEYWKVYPHIAPGGLLVIDDIHIPTIRQLFDFLREDDMFRLIETVGKTAFFERTKAATFSPVQDGWWLQKYNSSRFPIAYDHLSLGLETPQADAADYRARLLPLIDRWLSDGARVAIFGTGGHTELLFDIVPELEQLPIVAFLDTTADPRARYRGIQVRRPEWTPGRADVILCSSYAHEIAQLEILDMIPVKAVLSHIGGPSAYAISRAA